MLTDWLPEIALGFGLTSAVSVGVGVGIQFGIASGLYAFAAAMAFMSIIVCVVIGES